MANLKSGRDLVYSPEYEEKYNTNRRSLPYAQKGLPVTANSLFNNPGKEQIRQLNQQNLGITSRVLDTNDFFKEGNSALPQVPEMRSDPVPPVNLAATATEQPGYVSPEQIAQLRGDKQLENEFPQAPGLPEKNTLPQAPGYTQDSNNTPIPTFDNQYVESNYASLSDRTKNEERFARNEKDALAQDRASGAMVDRLNRGTKAMQELSQMRSGGGPAIANMGSNFRDSRLPDRTNNTNSERVGTKRWVARERELKNSRADRAMDIRENEGNQLPLGRTDRPTPDYGLEPEPGMSVANQIAVNKYKQGQLAKPITLADEIKGRKQKSDFIKNYSIEGFDGLPPEVGALIYDLGSRPGSSIGGIENLVRQELLNQKRLNPKADFANNPQKLMSQIRNRIRNEQAN